MSQINDIIQLNVELEGLLRVAESRQSPEAIELAKEKFLQLSALFASLDVDSTPNNTNLTPPIPHIAPITPISPSTSSESLIKTFTINDKFLFRRELFDGSEADFVDTLNLIEAMSSLDEAREYLFYDLGWDSENETVADFVNIINNYFENR